MDKYGVEMANCGTDRPGPLVSGAEGPKIQKRVWGELSAKLEKIQPGIMANV